jgi:ABC-2 type transport system permease protein
MFNFTLYKRGMRESWKMLLIFAAVLTVYVSIIITMYDPEMMTMLDEFSKAMPEIMAAVGMSPGASSLLGFMSSYLYGFILMVFPMVFAILCGNKLIARHVDRGSMTYLLAAPVKRSTVAFTQMKVIATGIFALTLYVTALQLFVGELAFPGELAIGKLLALNAGLLALQWFIGGISFLFSCICSDTKHATGLGAGIPALAYVLQMMANMGGNAENAKYATFFTLFNPDGIVAGERGAIAGAIVLFAGAIVLFSAAIVIFSKKDLHI